MKMFQSPIKPPPIDCFSTGTGCISGHSNACQGRADGHYQACENCNIYHSCSGGVIWANRQCPPTYYGGLNGRLVWVQVTPTEGRCDYTSSTCHGQGCSVSHVCCTSITCWLSVCVYMFLSLSLYVSIIQTINTLLSFLWQLQVFLS